ncbi:MAG: hypothetical protein HFH97_02370 [Lachnospiraceae bacterium]|nr:hypothetical protein [Lachnospiraceae bacterium]
MTSILRYELHDKKALSFQRKRCILVKPVGGCREMGGVLDGVESRGIPG